MANTKRDTFFRAAWDKAVAAGRAAAEAATPTPMVVYEADGLTDRPKPGGKSWYVPQGPCGFAWVTVRPGNSAFANWLKRNDLARKAYGGGVQHTVFGYGQSVTLKSAFADAVAASLRESLGLDFGQCYSGSRLD